MADLPAVGGSHDPERDVRLYANEFEKLSAYARGFAYMNYGTGEMVYPKRLHLKASNPPLEAFWLECRPENDWAVDWLDRHRKPCYLSEEEHAQLIRESTRERAVLTAWGSLSPRLLVGFGNQWAWDRLFHIRMSEGIRSDRQTVPWSEPDSDPLADILAAKEIIERNG